MFIAAGIGSFQPRPLKVQGIDRFNGSQLFYRVRDPAQFHGRNLAICGGGDSALDWTLALAGKAESVILLHRRDGFRAAAASVAKMREMAEKHVTIPRQSRGHSFWGPLEAAERQDCGCVRSSPLGYSRLHVFACSPLARLLLRHASTSWPHRSRSRFDSAFGARSPVGKLAFGEMRTS